MLKLSSSEIALINGGNAVKPWVIGLSFLGGGALLTALGLLGMCPPVRSGDHEVKMGGNFITGSLGNNVYTTEYRGYTFEVTRACCPYNACFANGFVCIGIGMMIGGILAFFGGERDSKDII